MWIECIVVLCHHKVKKSIIRWGPSVLNWGVCFLHYSSFSNVFAFPHKFLNVLYIATTISADVFIRIMLICKTNLKSVDTFIMLKFPTHEHNMSLHLFRSSDFLLLPFLWSSNNSFALINSYPSLSTSLLYLLCVYLIAFFLVSSVGNIVWQFLSVSTNSLTVFPAFQIPYISEITRYLSSVSDSPHPAQHPLGPPTPLQAWLSHTPLHTSPPPLHQSIHQQIPGLPLYPSHWK